MPPPTPGSACCDLVGARPRRRARRVGGVAQPAGDVGEEHHLVGAERARDRARGLVGVDVVGVALAVGADARRPPGCSPGRRGSARRRRRARSGPRSRCPGRDGAAWRAARNSSPSSPHSPTAGWPWRLSSSTMSLLTLPTSTILATSTVAASETRRPSTNSIGQVRAAACSWRSPGRRRGHDRVHADVLEQHDVARELLLERRVGHRRAAVLDHHRLAVELADVGQRLEQRGDVARRHAHVV